MLTKQFPFLLVAPGKLFTIFLILGNQNWVKFAYCILSLPNYPDKICCGSVKSVPLTAKTFFSFFLNVTILLKCLFLMLLTKLNDAWIRMIPAAIFKYEICSHPFRNEDNVALGLRPISGRCHWRRGITSL